MTINIQIFNESFLLYIQICIVSFDINLHSSLFNISGLNIPIGQQLSNRLNMSLKFMLTNIRPT